MELMPFKRSGAVFVAAVVIAVAAAWAMNSRSQAPSVTYTLLDGQQQSLHELQGKVTLVNFWATSCTTCMKEMPQIVETYEKFKDRGFTTLAVAMSYDPPAYVINYAQSRKLPFPVTIDNTGAIAKAFDDVQLTPTTFLLNQRGEIIKRYVGEPDFVALHELVDKLLKPS
jgi:peroxiredoxin